MAGIFICFIHWFIPDSWSCLSHGRYLISSCWIKYRNMQISPNKNGEAGRKILPCSCSLLAVTLLPLIAKFWKQEGSCISISSLLITPQPTIDGLQWPSLHQHLLLPWFLACYCWNQATHFMPLLHWKHCLLHTPSFIELLSASVWWIWFQILACFSGQSQCYQIHSTQIFVWFLKSFVFRN